MSLRDILKRADVRAPALDRATTWLNSEPQTSASLQGHAVAYDFWTYTCVNWLRTLPYLRAWSARYREHGLIVIGIHTPEFAFEHELANVEEAVAADRIDYPVVVDNDYAIWRAFDNHYWPALYIAGADGVIRHRQFGEGGYAEAERVIQQLLNDVGGRDVPRGLVDVDPEGVEVAADWDQVDSPETYLGRSRGGQGFVAERKDVRLNHWALDGAWTIRQDSAVLDEGEGTIAFRFRARDVNLVLASTRGQTSFRVLIDGRPPGSSHGADCDQAGQGVVSKSRLYQLIRQRDPIDEQTFEITFAAPGIAAFAFTFG
jgi:thiol-disulfide isomerase/thioredoxin